MTTNSERSDYREAGILITGVLLGGLLGIIGSLWSAFFVEWYRSTFPNTNWMPLVIFTSIVLVVIVAFLFILTRKLMQRS